MITKVTVLFRIPAFFAFFWLLICFPVLPAGATERIVVFVPASMGDVLEQIASDFEAETKLGVTLSIAGTATLARQLDAGAPADIFISADRVWMEWLAERQLIDAGSTVTIARNELVIAVPQAVENWMDAKAALTGFRFAMGEPDSVPAGRYGRQALEKLGWWNEAKSMAIFGENVRLALLRVVMGEVGAAIVYRSDVAAEKRVRIGYTFAKTSHDEIVYLASMTQFKNKSENPHVRAFLKYLSSSAAEKRFVDAEFLAAGAIN